MILKLFKKIILVLLVLSLFGCTAPVKKGTVVVLQTLSTENEAVIAEPFTMTETSEEVILAKQKTVVAAASANSTGIPWLISKVSDGTPQKEITTYRITYDSLGNVLSKVEVPDSKQIIESTPITYRYGAKPQLGAYFYPSFSRYGADCGGCTLSPQGTSGTASGAILGLGSVRQSDGAWKDGLTYDGYYVIATSASIPLCTIVEITDHSFTGSGLKPGVPFQAIALDRGVSGSQIDLFVGSENNLNVIDYTKKSTPKATIIRFATWTKNSLGQKICK